MWESDSVPELLTNVTRVFEVTCAVCSFYLGSVSTHENNQDSRLVLRVQGPVSGLAVDWIHHLLYWTSMGSGAVHVGLLDGSAQRVLVAGLEKPSAVAVDPLHRWAFAVPLTILNPGLR